MKLPLDRFENIEQVGGILPTVLDDGPGRGNRLAMVNTGGGLRYNVALDRGADIVHASYNQHSLCYLSPNGVKRPSHAYHTGKDWEYGWPGGMMTTCGPLWFGHPREEGGQRTSLHGHFSNSIAEVESIINPRVHEGQHEMSITATVRDTRVYGPVMSTRRTIASTLGRNMIGVSDRTTNRGNAACPFGLMYHVNFGWPLLDKDSRAVLSGHAQVWPGNNALMPEDVNAMKDIPAPSHKFAGTASRGFTCTPEADRNGLAHVGMVNRKLGIAVELEFAVEQLPRLLVWQHFGPGMYVTGIEPMVGSPYGPEKEPDHARTLSPGEAAETTLTIRVHDTPKAIDAFAKYDRPLKRRG